MKLKHFESYGLANPSPSRFGGEICLKENLAQIIHHNKSEKFQGITRIFYIQFTVTGTKAKVRDRKLFRSYLKNLKSKREAKDT